VSTLYLDRILNYSLVCFSASAVFAAHRRMTTSGVVSGYIYVNRLWLTSVGLFYLFSFLDPICPIYYSACRKRSHSLIL